MILILKENPKLADIQNYVRQMEKERGFNSSSNMQTCFQLGEEIGELFKAVRKAEKMRIDSNSDVTSIEEELADILIYISALANRYHIDLEKALREKEEINKKRVWQ
ncbi:MAG: MazG nucleotide pyrophosphohydrolase domain-containing protein [bacterium]|nr:MazG nucleotide pyrophosphohydrolase domain-containing protein [bacterium]